MVDVVVEGVGVALLLVFLLGIAGLLGHHSWRAATIAEQRRARRKAGIVDHEAEARERRYRLRWNVAAIAVLCLTLISSVFVD